MSSNNATMINAAKLGKELTSSVKLLQYLVQCIEWFDSWQSHIKKTVMDSKKFLSPSTAAGLRVTLKSTVELSTFLLQSGFTYVLTSRFSQDPLEVVALLCNL